MENFAKIIDLIFDYRKENIKNVENVNSEHGETAVELDLDDRIFSTTPIDSYVTLKDHKADFRTNPSVRLINPRKPELGKIAMKILDSTVREIRHVSRLKQFTNTQEVINWFNGLKNKNRLNFIVFDVENFYPSITPELLNKALCWAGNFVNLSKQQTKIIHQASQSFLYHEGQPWVKKGSVNFDIGMGAYHGAQACEIVGLYMLNLLKDLPNFESILYRDDGLGITPSTPRLQEKLRQQIIKKFAEQDLKITITINQKRVDFLDITMDLETGLYQPYRNQSGVIYQATVKNTMGQENNYETSKQF